MAVRGGNASDGAAGWGRRGNKKRKQKGVEKKKSGVSDPCPRFGVRGFFPFAFLFWRGCGFFFFFFSFPGVFFFLARFSFSFFRGLAGSDERAISVGHCCGKYRRGVYIWAFGCVQCADTGDGRRGTAIASARPASLQPVLLGRGAHPVCCSVPMAAPICTWRCKTKENRGRYPSHGSRAWRRLYRWVAHGNCCPSPALTRSRRGSERLASERLARVGPSASLASGLRAPRFPRPIPPALGTLPACSRHVAAWVVARTRVWGRASQLARCRFPWGQGGLGQGQEAGIALLAVRCCKNPASRACTDERTDGQTDKTRAGLHRVQMWGAGWGYSCR